MVKEIDWPRLIGLQRDWGHLGLGKIRDVAPHRGTIVPAKVKCTPRAVAFMRGGLHLFGCNPSHRQLCLFDLRPDFHLLKESESLL